MEKDDGSHGGVWDGGCETNEERVRRGVGRNGRGGTLEVGRRRNVGWRNVCRKGKGRDTGSWTKKERGLEDRVQEGESEGHWKLDEGGSWAGGERGHCMGSGKGGGEVEVTVHAILAIGN